LIAWLMWRGAYLVKMPGRLMRLRVTTDWLLDLFFGREITELPSIRPGDLAGERPRLGHQHKPSEEQQKPEEAIA
jgi:hypothetical protein